MPNEPNNLNPSKPNWEHLPNWEGRTSESRRQTLSRPPLLPPGCKNIPNRITVYDSLPNINFPVLKCCPMCPTTSSTIQLLHQVVTYTILTILHSLHNNIMFATRLRTSSRCHDLLAC